MQRNGEWSSEAKLFQSGATVCPANAKIHYNLGKIYSDGGSRSDAERKYRQALTLNPHYEQAMNNLANVLKDEGQLQEAKQLLEHALNIRYADLPFSYKYNRALSCQLKILTILYCVFVNCLVVIKVNLLSVLLKRIQNQV